jgi:hypothetical protein
MEVLDLKDLRAKILQVLILHDLKSIVFIGMRLSWKWQISKNLNGA